MAKEKKELTPLRLPISVLAEAERLAEINQSTRHAELVKFCVRGSKKPL